MQNILNYLNENPVVKSVITFLLQAAAVILITIVILWLSRKLFRNIQAHSKKLNTQFTEKVFRFPRIQSAQTFEDIDIKMEMSSETINRI